MQGMVVQGLTRGLTGGLTGGLILAGGAARRMGGGDKPLRPLGGACLLDWVVGAVAPQVGALAISANGAPERFARWGLPVVADGVAGQGPLGGVLAGLRWAGAMGAARLLVVPGDAPFLPADLVARLGAAGPVAHAASGGRDHPVVAVVAVAHAEGLAAWLAAGGRAVGGWLASVGSVRVAWGMAEGDPFANVNTPEELAAAEARVGAAPVGGVAAPGLIVHGSVATPGSRP